PAGPIRVPRGDAPISRGAPSTAIFFARLDFEVSITASPLTCLYYAREYLAKDRKKPFGSALIIIPGFPRDFGRQCTTRGNKILSPAFLLRAPYPTLITARTSESRSAVDTLFTTKARADSCMRRLHRSATS